MSNLVTRATELVYQMNNDEINQLVEAIKLKRTHLARTTPRALAEGDTVQFEARGRMVQGTVTKVNRKTVVVREHGSNSIYGTNWRVTASLLTKVEMA